MRVPSDYPTIQAALNATGNADVVLVSPGTYRENVVFNGKATRLVSEAGPSTTIIDGGLQGAVVLFDGSEGPSSVLEGFTVRNGSDPHGAGVSIWFSSPTIRHNVIENNSGNKAGVLCNGSGSLIDSNLFRNNRCDGQPHNAVLSFINITTGRAINNVFLSNDCPGVDATSSDAPEFVHNTFVNNRVAISLDAGGASIRKVILRNNLIFGGGIGLSIDFGTGFFPDYANLPIWEHNLVFGSQQNYVGIGDLAGQNGNLTIDPELVSAATGDVHLRPTSPVIDAGIAVGISAPTVDFDGSSRPVDGDHNGTAIPDIGAVEFQ